MRLKLSRQEPKESAVLDAVRRALRIHPAVCWHERMNSGAYAVGEGSARRFVRFGFKGCPDIIGHMRDVPYITFRCPDCGQSKSIKGRKSRGWKAGYRCSCCHAKKVAK